MKIFGYIIGFLAIALLLLGNYLVWFTNWNKFIYDRFGGKVFGIELTLKGLTWYHRVAGAFGLLSSLILVIGNIVNNGL